MLKLSFSFKKIQLIWTLLLAEWLYLRNFINLFICTHSSLDCRHKAKCEKQRFSGVPTSAGDSADMLPLAGNHTWFSPCVPYHPMKDAHACQFRLYC